MTESAPTTFKCDDTLINGAVDALIAHDAATAKSKLKQLFKVIPREAA